MKSLSKCISDIKSSKNIAIFTHLDPDADALASAVALKKLIKNNLPDSDKIIDLFFDYSELSETVGAIIKGVAHNVVRCNHYDLSIALDCASASRLGRWQELFNASPIRVNFDHHITNENFADNNLILKTSSTCEGIYLVAKAKNLTIADDICSLIYSGIITDTNNLTQGTITAQTHKIIAEMLERKINLDALNQHFFKNNTKSNTFLLKKALESLKFYSDDRIAVMRLSKENLSSCEAGKDDTLGIVNHGIEINGVDIAILSIRQEDDSYYVSLRSKNNVSVANIATKMGGGGHDQVAAFQYTGNFSEMFEKLLSACKEELDAHKNEENGELLFVGDDEDEIKIKN